MQDNRVTPPARIADIPQARIGSYLTRAISNPNNPPNFAEIWLYSPAPRVVMGTLETIDELTAMGWQEVPDIYQVLLNTQLHETIHVRAIGNEKLTLWTHRDSAAYVEKYPVALVSEMEFDEQQIKSAALPVREIPTLAILNPLPLPSAGMGGFILNIQNPDASLSGYRLSSLDDAPQQRHTLLSLYLKEMSSPATWVLQTSYHHLALDTDACVEQIDRLTNHALGLLESKPDTDPQAYHQLLDEIGKIKSALQEMNQVFRIHEKSSYESDMKEVRQLMQALARDYYEHHQFIIQKKKSPVPVPDIPDAFNAEGIARMLTSLPIEAFTVATTAPLEQWNTYTSDKENELILGFPYKKPSGLYHVLVKEDATGQDRKQVLARMEKSITDMGDYDSDLFMMMVLQLMVGRRNENGNVVMTTRKALEYHGALCKKSANDHQLERSGGHRWEDLEKWSESYLRMKNKWMKLDEVEILDDTSKPDKKGQLKRARINREAPLFMFGEVITHETLPLDGNPGKKIIIAWEYREATWMLPFIKGNNAYTSGIMRDCFMFDPYHETWEKRLSKHFFFWLRRNAKYEEPKPVKIRDLFDELHLDTNERHPQRTRDHFERAMDVLAGKAPRLVGQKKQLEKAHLKWEYANTFELPRSNWLETWLAQKIKVTPPENNQNAHILDAVRERRELIQAHEAKNAAKRRRGRPPGSKNKNKQQSDSNQK